MTPIAVHNQRSSFLGRIWLRRCLRRTVALATAAALTISPATLDVALAQAGCTPVPTTSAAASTPTTSASSATGTPTATATGTPTGTPTPTPTGTPTPTPSPTDTVTPTPTGTNTPDATGTAVEATATASAATATASAATTPGSPTVDATGTANALATQTASAVTTRYANARDAHRRRDGYRKRYCHPDRRRVDPERNTRHAHAGHTHPGTPTVDATGTANALATQLPPPQR